MASHTELPWVSEDTTIYKLSPTEDGFGLGGLANHFYCSMQRGHGNGASKDELLANATFIVKACNNFYPLLAALKAAEPFLVDYERAREAIKQAEQ